jgi:hypothetical protein
MHEAKMINRNLPKSKRLRAEEIGKEQNHHLSMEQSRPFTLEKGYDSTKLKEWKAKFELVQTGRTGWNDVKVGLFVDAKACPSLTHAITASCKDEHEAQILEKFWNVLSFKAFFVRTRRMWSTLDGGDKAETLAARLFKVAMKTFHPEKGTPSLDPVSEFIDVLTDMWNEERHAEEIANKNNWKTHRARLHEAISQTNLNKANADTPNEILKFDMVEKKCKNFKEWAKALYKQAYETQELATKYQLKVGQHATTDDVAKKSTSAKTVAAIQEMKGQPAEKSQQATRPATKPQQSNQFPIHQQNNLKNFISYDADGYCTGCGKKDRHKQHLNRDPCGHILSGYFNRDCTVSWKKSVPGRQYASHFPDKCDHIYPLRDRGRHPGNFRAWKEGNQAKPDQRFNNAGNPYSKNGGDDNSNNKTAGAGGNYSRGEGDNLAH